MSLAAHGYEGDVLNEGLYVSYANRNGRITTSTTSRIAGVQTYLEKWEPTFKEWIGDRAGRRFARQYFAEVLGRLAADKLVYGRVGEASKAAFSVVGYSGLAIALPRLSTYSAEAIARRVLPRPAISLIKRLRSRRRRDR